MKLPLTHVPLTSTILSGDSLLKFCLNQSANPDTVIVSVDLSKWCQYQRQKVFIGSIAKELISLYGSSPLYELADMLSHAYRPVLL